MNFKRFVEGAESRLRPRRKNTIKWIRIGDPEDPTDVGFESTDGRFVIEPQYHHTVRPSGYWLYDNVTKKRHDTHGGVQGAKDKAEDIVRPPPPPPTEEERKAEVVRAWRMGLSCGSNLNGEWMTKVKALADQLGVELPSS